MEKKQSEMDKLYEDSETGCCPKFNPEPWQKRKVTFENKLFLKDRVRSFMHLPLNFGKVMVRNMEKIKQANALAETPFMLSDECSLWRSDLYIAVSREVPDAEMVKMSGTFLTKVFEGEYKNIKSWMTEMEEYVKSKGKETKKLYFFYTTCPRCAKHYGKNYTVLLAKI